MESPWMSRLSYDWDELRKATIATFFFSVLTTLLRFLSRRIDKAPTLFDDWLIIPALVFSPKHASHFGLTMG